MAFADARTQVCVIEDDADVRETLYFLLIDEGYRVLQAANDIEGRAILDTSAESLVILLDYWLSKRRGCDMLDCLAQYCLPPQRHAVIMMSTNPQRTLDECGDALTALSAPIIPMPFDVDEVVRAVRQAEDRLAQAPAT